MENFKIEVDSDGVALVTFDVPGRTMNTLTASVIKEIGDVVETIKSDANIKGAVITSGKTTGFCAGADLGELGGSGGLGGALGGGGERRGGGEHRRRGGAGGQRNRRCGGAGGGEIIQLENVEAHVLLGDKEAAGGGIDDHVVDGPVRAECRHRLRPGCEPATGRG